MANILKSKTMFSANAPIASEQTGSFQWDDVVERAQEYLETVRAQAKTILEECENECTVRREEARQQGLEEGHSQIERMAASRAAELASEQIQEATNAIQTLCKSLEVATQQWLREWQHETVSIAICIAEKLLARQMDADPSILLGWIDDSVRMIRNQSRITIQLHPQDAMLLSQALPQLLEQSAPGIEIQIVETPAVGRYGAILQTADATIDRSMATQLKRLEHELQ
jgi:flagellar biosynthesis/type III secretory pathway protein FliH